MKVVFATPTIKRPYAPYLEALEASVPVLDSAGIEHQVVFKVGCPYISGARAELTRAALDAKADAIVYLDHDVSWDPQDLVKLIRTEGDVVAGTYRLKQDTEEYMGVHFCDPAGRPVVRPSDGAIKARLVPAGFLKVTKEGINRFMHAFPELTYGPLFNQSVDLFNHGAVLGDRIWWGEDFCFAQRWNDKCGDLWLVPNLNIVHHGQDGTAYPGNYHNHLRRNPGGDLSANPLPPQRPVASLKAIA